MHRGVWLGLTALNSARRIVRGLVGLSEAKPNLQEHRELSLRERRVRLFFETQMVQPGVVAAAGEQLGVGALLNDATLVDDHNPVGVDDGR